MCRVRCELIQSSLWLLDRGIWMTAVAVDVVFVGVDPISAAKNHSGVKNSSDLSSTIAPHERT